MRFRSFYFIPIILLSCNNMPKEEGHAAFESNVQVKEDKKEEHDHHHGANHHMHKHSFEQLIERFESRKRDAYQEPNKVLKFMGDLSGKTVLDIGTGTGYFSFKLHDEGAKVIAGDVDERFQEYIKNKRDSLHISEEEISLRILPYDSPNLSEKEVDKVLIVNTYHHIEQRIAYFKQVKDGLKANGELIIVDFFKKETPFGPPVRMKLSEEEVLDELRKAGFEHFEVESEVLKYQYLIRAKK